MKLVTVPAVFVVAGGTAISMRYVATVVSGHDTQLGVASSTSHGDDAIQGQADATSILCLVTGSFQTKYPVGPVVVPV